MFKDSDERLCRLFARHTSDSGVAGAVVECLERRLSEIAMQFDPLAKIREVEFPTIPANRYPSFIYYFVPGANFSSHKPQPSPPTHSDFVYSADGIGLNLGCPVRLALALEALDYVTENERAEIKQNIATPHKHLPAVEELLWLRGWQSQTNCRRGGSLVGSTNVDWFFNAAGQPLYLEAKFRPADWPLMTDDGTHRPIEGGLLKNAAKKFPGQRDNKALHVVGVTGPADMSEWLAHAYGRELETYEQIDAVVYRSFASMTHVLSLNENTTDKVINLLTTPRVGALPTNYFIPSLQTAKEQRVKLRQSEQKAERLKTSAVFSRSLKPHFDKAVQIVEEDFYRMNIKSRGENDEPLFEVIPRLIPVH